MTEAISDTGPLLHLREIGRLDALDVFGRLLVRASRLGRLNRHDLDRVIYALFDASTLHLSQAFRAYVRQMLADLP